MMRQRLESSEGWAVKPEDDGASAVCLRSACDICGFDVLFDYMFVKLLARTSGLSR